MKKTVKIEGLDCPNCARTLEGQIAKIKGVENVNLDFLNSSLTFESHDVEKSLSAIIKLTKKFDPNIKIDNDEHKKKINVNFILDLVFLAVGLAIAVNLLLVNFSVYSMPKSVFWVLYALSALMLGYKVYYKAVMLLFKGVINENLLITISVIGATFISEHLEGLMVIALYSIGKIFEGLAVGKSRRSIEKLAKIQPEYAVILKDDLTEEKVTPDQVNVGSIIIVRPGEKVAIDGIIVDGESDFNNQSLTGESLPIHLTKGQEVLSGSVVIDGVVKIKTTTVYKDSTISKIMDLVAHAQQNKSKTETFISKITKYYTLGIIILAILVSGIVWAIDGNILTGISRGLIFLVVSCPCAFAISVPLAYFAGLGNASKNGILIKGSNYLDGCCKLNIIAFDKTGTLTTGKFEIDKISSFDEKYNEQEILFLSALGEQYSLHPIAKSIFEEAKKYDDFQNLSKENVTNIKEISGQGVYFDFQNNHYFVGRKNKDCKGTTVELFNEDKKIGEISLNDKLKDSSIKTCEQLKKLGIMTTLLSGDNKEAVDKIASTLQMDNSYCQLLPQDKYKIIEEYKKQKKFVGYIGDGINDAPSLTLADIGISMGINGSPASVEASDIVLVDDNPLKIVDAIKISKNTRKIVIEDIAFSAIVKIVFLTLGAIGITGMLSAVFADVGVTLLAILNSMRALKTPKDKIKDRV